MKNIYAEIGLGNDSFFSTEIEEGDSEYRIDKFILDFGCSRKSW